jgi:predicted  nucleic acid-binding Zn-ribbon protein
MGAIENLFNLAQSALTSDEQFKNLREGLDQVRQRLHILADEVIDLRERVTRLETFRDVDQMRIGAELARFQAEVAQFKADVERAELRRERQLPPPSQGPQET